MKKIIPCLLLLIILPIAYGLTASIENARMVIHTQVLEGETTIIEKHITVNNVNDIPVKISLEPKGDLVDIMELLDKDFTLQPGESKDANFIITLKQGGTYESNINIKFTSLEGNNEVEVSSTIIIIASGPENQEQEIPEEPEEEPEEEILEEPGEKELEKEEEGITITIEDKAQESEKKKEDKEIKKPNLLVGLLIILIIVVVGVIISLVIMLSLRKKIKKKNFSLKN